ncbi:hypothetical protein P5673_020005, partial [Acropora cervicornis]
MVSILLESSSSSNVTIEIVDVRMGTEVWINKQINAIMKLCDVEIFQTTIVRIITDVGYKRHHLTGLRILV